MRLEIRLDEQAHFQVYSALGLEASVVVSPWLALELLRGNSALGDGRLLLYSMHDELIARMALDELGRIPLAHFSQLRAVLEQTAR
jgi:hypothetical protein